MSTLKTTNIAHPSSASNNIVLDSSGGVDMDAFTVSGSAPADSVNLDASGRLLVGTSTAPANGGQSQYSKLAVYGNTFDSTAAGHIVIGRNQAAGTIASGDAIGRVVFADSNGYQYGMIDCFADAGTGSGDYPGRLVFSTTADGASSPTEAFRIDSYQTLQFQDSSVSWNIRSKRPSGPNQGHVQFVNGGNNVGYISTSTTSTAYNTSSDYRLKENVVPLTGAVDRLNQLQVHRFNFITDPDKTVDGFLAHEAQAVVPECVTGEKDAVDDDGNPVYQGIDQSKLVPLLTAALQEALHKIETQAGVITALDARLKVLEAQ